MSTSHYYVPEHSHWPIVGSLGLFAFVLGLINLFHSHVGMGIAFSVLGVGILIFMMVGWFASVIHENQTGLHNAQMGRSYRWGMVWFIFSEIMFFAAFFGALFYIRVYSVPWLAGEGSGLQTHLLLWPHFKAVWPLYHNPNQELFAGPKHILGAFGLPAINTLILLTSALTLTWAHWSLKRNQRDQVIIGLVLTILLGVAFICCQAYEYTSAHIHDGLTMGSGVFGSTFYLLTGFHGLHVTIGAIMLTVILFRCIKGHFTAEEHFGFEACAWYWHFVDFVWLTLFVFVYWI